MLMGECVPLPVHLIADAVPRTNRTKCHVAALEVDLLNDAYCMQYPYQSEGRFAAGLPMAMQMGMGVASAPHFFPRQRPTAGSCLQTHCLGV